MNAFTLGKFMPPHRGHELIIDWGSKLFEYFTVLVGGNETDIIPLSLRVKWLEEHYKNTNVNILSVIDDIPSAELDAEGVAPDWYIDLWIEKIKKLGDFSAIVTGEVYGKTIAERMNIQYIIVYRDFIPISATKIRDNPSKYFKYIMEEAQEYFEWYRN